MLYPEDGSVRFGTEIHTVHSDPKARFHSSISSSSETTLRLLFDPLALDSTMWPFSSDGSEAGSSSTQAGPSTPLIPSTPVTTATPGQDPTAETPTSQPNAASTRDDTPKSRWSRTIEDELSYQARIYPTTEELPSCMSIMYVSTVSQASFLIHPYLFYAP